MKLVFFVLTLLPTMANAFNLVGGKYSNLNDAATARVKGASAAWLNPAGLANEKSSSISSGASAYSYNFVSENNESSFTTSSSTSHVGMVKTTDYYVFGFLLYTSFSQDRISEGENYGKNAEGYIQGSAYKNNISLNQNIYVVALSKKKSNWGASFNLIQTNFDITQKSFSQNYSSTPTDRKNKIQSIEVDAQEYSANLAFGQQLKINDQWSWGYKVVSPTYLVYGKGNYDFNYLQVNGVDANNASVLQGHYDSDTKNVYSTIGEWFVLGTTYYSEKYTVSFDIVHNSGYSTEKDKIEDKGDYVFWYSQTDLYQESQSEITSGGGPSSHNGIVLNSSIEFNINDDQSYGFGASYQPTSYKGGKGMNIFSLSGGYTEKYKNFIGSYGINYQRGIDTGKNTTEDDITGEEVDSKEEFEAINLLISGAYYF